MEAESPKGRCTQVQGLVRTSYSLTEGHLGICSQNIKQRENQALPSLIMTLTPFVRALPSLSNYFPKAPSPNTNTLMDLGFNK